MLRIGLLATLSAIFLAACQPTPPMQTDSVSDVAESVRFMSAPAGYWSNQSPRRYSFGKTSEPVRYGATAERFEVRWGDCGGTDCGAPRYRSEIGVSRGRTRARFDQDIWYGWSFRNGNIPDFSGSTNPFITVGQWKMGGSNNPIIKIQQLGRGDNNFSGCNSSICSRSVSAPSGDVFLQLGDMMNVVPANAQNNWMQVCRLFDMRSAKTQWQDIVLNTNFSTSDNGYLNVWVNGRQVCAYRGRIVATKDTSMYPGPNHRRGIYVSGHRRWDNARPGQPLPTFIAYYDEFRVGKSRAEVDVRMIE